MYKYRRIIISIIAFLLIGSMVFGLVVMVLGASSATIKKQIEELEKKADEIAEAQQRLKEQISANNNETLSIVEQKAQIDQEVELTRQEVENINEQLRQYNWLIAEKQAELDDLQQEQTDLLERYKLRIRAMQEQGDISYWEVIFESSSFSQMLNRLAMVEEVAKSDQRMMDELREIASDLLSAKEELAAEKVVIEEKKLQLAAAEETLIEKREEADVVLTQLIETANELASEEEKYEDLQNELAEEIGRKEQEYNEAKAKEEEERRQQEQENQSGGSSSSGGGSTGAGESFLYPLPRNCGSWCTSPYGTRLHPISNTYRFHNGVDLAANTGTPIYASKSGTVTTATYAYSWGYYVVINHGDGFSTLYAHMTHYTVSVGDHVNRGETIGYVGSTGNSTGAHLHFTVYKNGSTVNPFNYVSVP